MTRADIFLVEKGYASSRAEAQAAIRAGHVRADGKPVVKALADRSPRMPPSTMRKRILMFRAARLKLAAALDRFALSPAGLTCLDVGVSTGGFTESCSNAARIRSMPSMSATASCMGGSPPIRA